MPQAVTHFLIPAILVALFRDFYLRKRDKTKFPLHYVLIAGLGGMLIDLDYVIYYAIMLFGFDFPSHRIFFHNLFFPLIFLILGFLFIGTRNKELGKHKLKLSTIFFIICFATITHLILDVIVNGKIIPFYPFSMYGFGFDLIKKLPEMFQDSIIPIIDAVLLAGWMIWMEVRHKISDFI